MIKLKKHS